MKKTGLLIGGVILGIVLFCGAFFAFEFLWGEINQGLSLLKPATILLAAAVSALAITGALVIISWKSKRAFATGLLSAIVIASLGIYVYTQKNAPLCQARAQDKDRAMLEGRLAFDEANVLLSTGQ